MKVSVIIIKCNYGFIRVSNMILNISSHLSDTIEIKLNISSNGSDTSNSNRSDMSSSNSSDTIETKLNTSSNGCDTSNSNRSDTSSSITSVTLIKQYKNKKRNIYKDF